MTSNKKKYDKQAKKVPCNPNSGLGLHKMLALVIKNSSLFKLGIADTLPMLDHKLLWNLPSVSDVVCHVARHGLPLDTNKSNVPLF